MMLKVRRSSLTLSSCLDLSLGDDAYVVIVAMSEYLLTIFEIFTQGVVILFVVIIITFV